MANKITSYAQMTKKERAKEKYLRFYNAHHEELDFLLRNKSFNKRTKEQQRLVNKHSQLVNNFMRAYITI